MLDSGSGPVYHGSCFDWSMIFSESRRPLFRIMLGNGIAAVTTGIDSSFNTERPGVLGATGLAWTVFALALATLAGAWFFQLVLGLKPCPLCLEQRYAYYVAIPLAAAVAIASGRVSRRTVAIGFAMIALAMLANAGLALYHAGVEWGFWPGPSDCSGPMIDLNSGSLLDRIGKVKVVRCDEVQWRFLGLSLAGYNVLISLMIAAIAARGVRAAR